MNAPTQVLPAGYVQSEEINLKKNKRLTMLLSLIALFVFVASFMLLSIFVSRVRFGVTSVSGDVSLGVVLMLLVLTVMILIVHELIHGFFFWMFSRSRPVFGIQLMYAYAGAPTWFFPRSQYAITALAPLVIIGVVGLFLMLLVPLWWLLMIAFLVALNTSGAVGDVFVFIRLLKSSPSSFANDTGDVVTFYERPVVVA